MAQCQNCDGRLCMSCVLRKIHDRCREDCPECCGEGRMDDLEQLLENFSGKEGSTHYTDCHLHHPECAVAYLVRRVREAREVHVCGQHEEPVIACTYCLRDCGDRAERAEVRLAEAERVVEAAQEMERSEREVFLFGEPVAYASVKWALAKLQEALDAYDREEADGGR